MERFKHTVVGMAVIAVFLYAVFSVVKTEENYRFTQVKSGEYKLWCGITSWQKVDYIEPHLVKSFDNGTWKFKNGYARNCETIKAGG